MILPGGEMIDQIPTVSRPGWARIEAEYDLIEADRVLGHPMLVNVLRLWMGLRRNGQPPSREDIDALILQPGVFPQIMLLEALSRCGRRDLRYRLVGVGLANNFGNDMTGRYVRDVFADETYASELISAAYLVIDRCQPIATSGRFVAEQPGDAPTMVYRLGLPLQKLPSGTPLLLVCQMCVTKGEIVERPLRQLNTYEPINVVAFVDRMAGGGQPK
jgi:hypothetical protein